MTASRPLLEDCSIISPALRRAALTGSVITCSSAWGHSDYQLPRTSIHVELLHWPTDSEHPTIPPPGLTIQCASRFCPRCPPGNQRYSAWANALLPFRQVQETPMPRRGRLRMAKTRAGLRMGAADEIRSGQCDPRGLRSVPG